MIIAPSIVAYAGRRIDAPGTSPRRFPSDNLARVERDIAAFFDARAISTVVGSAACGADIVILEAARKHRVRTHIVLPFDAATFRDTSVVDRDSDWGPRYDLALAHAAEQGRVIVVAQAPGSAADAYARATEAIFAEAEQLAREREHAVTALVVWDENPRSSGDATLQFFDLAKQKQLECTEVSTL